MIYATFDEIEQKLKSMVAAFFDDLDKAYKQGMDVPEQSPLFLQTFPCFQPKITSGGHMPREAAISNWLHHAWAEILGQLNPKKWQKTTKGQYRKSNATIFIRCVVAHMRWLDKPIAKKQKWTGSDLAEYFKTPELVLTEYTRITSIRTDAWFEANKDAGLERLFGISSPTPNIPLEPGHWNKRVREGQELIFDIEERAWEISEWVRQHSPTGPDQIARKLKSTQLISDEEFQQLLPPPGYSPPQRYSEVNADQDSSEAELTEDDEIVDPPIVFEFRQKSGKKMKLAQCLRSV